MIAMRCSILAVAVVAALGCKGKRGHDGAPAATRDGGTAATRDGGGPPAAAELARCVSMLETAATLPPLERAGTIVRGCPVCGRPWDPLIVADHADEGAPVDLEELWRVVQACGGVCTRTAGGDLKGGLADLSPGKPATRPWRKLAEACPAPLRADDHSLRFVNATWYVLATIGEKLREARATLPPTEQGRLDAAQAKLRLPLPPLSSAGTAFVVAPGGIQPGTPWHHITLTDAATFVGRLPFAHLAADGLRVDDGGVGYPGVQVAGDGLAAAVDAARASGPAPDLPDRIDEPVIIAPRGAPARRVLETMAALGDHRAFLAVATSAPAALWRGMIGAQPLPLAATAPAQPRLRFGLASLRVASVDAAGKVLASAPLHAPERPVAERWRAAANAVAPGRVVELVAEDASVAELAAVLDGLAGAGATVAVPAGKDAKVTGGDLPTFDATRLRGVLAP